MMNTMQNPTPPASVRINTLACARGWLDYDNEWTSSDAQANALELLAQHAKQDGDHYLLGDGSRVYVDAFGMHAA